MKYLTWASGSPQLVQRVRVGQLLADDPVGHRVDVPPRHVAAEAVGLEEGRPSPHERIGDPEVVEAMGQVVRLHQRVVREFAEEQGPKKGTRTAREPLVDGDDRSDVLLELLLFQRQAGDEGDVEAPFDAVVEARFAPGLNLGLEQRPLARGGGGADRGGEGHGLGRGSDG
jgi:hypothetical protein